jgi:hypothetical protein
VEDKRDYEYEGRLFASLFRLQRTPTARSFSCLGREIIYPIARRFQKCTRANKMFARYDQNATSYDHGRSISVGVGTAGKS